MRHEIRCGSVRGDRVNEQPPEAGCGRIKPRIAVPSEPKGYHDPVIKLLIDSSEIRREFQEAARKASKLRFLTAWATPGDHLAELKNRDLEVDAVVGIDPPVTDPDALVTLNTLGGLRIAAKPREGGLFHPKLYLFEGRRFRRLLAGSPNFTDAAFKRNSESVISCEPTDALWNHAIDAFNRSYGAGQPFQLFDLAGYRVRHRAFMDRTMAEDEGPPRKQRTLPTVNFALADQGKLLRRDWASFRRVITRRRGEEIISGPEHSYLNTLETAHKTLVSKPWAQLDDNERGIVLGAKAIGLDGRPHDFGWIGSLKANGSGLKWLRESPEMNHIIDELLRPVARTLEPMRALQRARAFWNAITSWDNVKHAAASRLLAIARPDLFFSVNQKSLARLARLFDCDEAGLREWDGYAACAQAIWRANWYRHGPSSGQVEKRLWGLRAALIDAWAYEDK